jgi:hypothetical protein
MHSALLFPDKQQSSGIPEVSAWANRVGAIPVGLISSSAPLCARPQHHNKFTMLLCRIHHRVVHSCHDERAWWKDVGIDHIKSPIRSEKNRVSRMTKTGAIRPHSRRFSITSQITRYTYARPFTFFDRNQLFGFVFLFTTPTAFITGSRYWVSSPDLGNNLSMSVTVLAGPISFPFLH